MSILSVEKITAAYKKNFTNPILLDTSIYVSQGEFTCLCGKNGCGKSTLLGILSGIQNQNLKIISASKMPNIDGKPIHNLKRLDCAKKIAFMQQNETFMWNFSVKDFLLQGRFCHSNGGFYSKKDYYVAEKVATEMEIENFLYRNVNELSGGEFQKIRIARALCQEPDFMLLDEPATNLDYVYEPQLMDLLKNLAHSKKIGILAIVHNINLAYNFADRICFLPPQQKIIEGKPEQVMTAENLKLTFGVDFQCKETKLFQSLQ